MANRAKYDATEERALRMTGAMPAWVKLLAAVGLVLVVLFVILHLSGHGFGPQMHMPHS